MESNQKDFYVSNFSSLAAALAVSTVAAALKEAEALRARAQECDERASRTSDSWTKQQFEECAEQWRRLADQAEGQIR